MDLGQCRARRVQHDVFALTDLQDAVQPLQDAVDERLLFVVERCQCLDDYGLALEQDVDFFESVGDERRACGDKIADIVRAPEFGRDFNGARKIDDLRINTMFSKVFC